MKTTLNMESEEVTKKALEVMKTETLTDRLFKWSPDQLPVEEKKRVCKCNRQTVLRMVRVFFFFSNACFVFGT